VATRSRNPEVAKAFVDFVTSPQGQEIFARKGYRPVDRQAAAAAGFPEPSGLFTIDDLGGWSDVSKRFFDKENGVLAGIEQQVGVSVGS
jgi:sulfate/thiosulfate transport system substrate-binding protein